MKLDPYLVVVSARDRSSRASILLRAAGYQVTKLPESAVAAREAILLQPDGVILDLPPLQANRMTAQLAAMAPTIPLLVVTSAPAFVHGPAIPRMEIEWALTTAVDRLLVESRRVA